MAGSAIPGFFKKDRAERIRLVKEHAGLTEEETRLLDGGISFAEADRMVENAIGTFALPLGVATNFAVNGRDVLVPMVIEEPSVVAAASRAAKAARVHGGFTAEATEPLVPGQIQVLGADMGRAIDGVRAASREILDVANACSTTLSRMGRGAREVTTREVGTDTGPMLVVELLVDVGDAMGANVVNSMCEAAAPVIERVTGGEVVLRILSNYTTQRLARASAVFDGSMAGGPEIVGKMIAAYQLARYDVYRAVTHNKGVMNGCIAVSGATGQDSRAIEAAAHAYAARSGRYTSLTGWSQDSQGNIVGSLEMPLSVGTVGGVTAVHPLARLCIKMTGASSAQELACVIVSAGLAQNFAALRALSAEGIQKGHMRLHARNVAAAAGATPEQIDRIAAKMAEEGDISPRRARDLLD